MLKRKYVPRSLIWTFIWLIYATLIVYVIWDRGIVIHNEKLTKGIAIVWIFLPFLAYFVGREKAEIKDKRVEDIELREEFDREMLGK